MGLKDELIKQHQENAYLISDKNQTSKTKEEYMQSAKEGLILAFRLNFESKLGVPLTKVISGMIMENDTEKEQFVVETRNKLQYGVPYSQAVWVKTGYKWPKGVYEEMKRGTVKVEVDELGEISDEKFDHDDWDKDTEQQKDNDPYEI